MVHFCCPSKYECSDLILVSLEAAGTYTERAVDDCASPPAS